MLFLCTLLLAPIILDAKLQNIKVSGTVVCNGKPVKNAAVELWEKDIFDPNDLLDRQYTDSKGMFLTQGAEDEVTTITPFIKIIHSCNAPANCVRISKFPVPEEFVDSGVYSMTTISLNLEVIDQKDRCRLSKEDARIFES